MSGDKATFGTIMSGEIAREYERKMKEFEEQLKKDMAEKQKRETEKQKQAEIEKQRAAEIERKKAEDAERNRVREAQEAARQQSKNERQRLSDENQDIQEMGFDNWMAAQTEVRRKQRQEEQNYLQDRVQTNAALETTETEKSIEENESATDSNFELNDDVVDEVEQDSDDENPPPAKETGRRQAKKGSFSTPELVAAFHEHGYTGTAYPDLETADTLGFRADYESLIAGCGVKKYVGMQEPTYPAAASEFLATVTFYATSGKALMTQMSGGYITFQISGAEYMLTLKQLEDHFEFPTGRPVSMQVKKEAQHVAWQLMTGVDKFESGVKQNIRIRSPPIAYTRKVIAETFVCRAKTGPARAADINLLIRGLQNVLSYHPVTDKLIEGDSAGAGLAYALVKYLESYRMKLSTNLRRGNAIMPITIGGPITSILKLAKVGIDWDSADVDKIAPRSMDALYLKKQCFLIGSIDGPEYYYRIQIPGQSEKVFILPNTAETTLNVAMHAQFLPSPDLLIDPQTLADDSTPAPRKKAIAAPATTRKKTAPPTPKGSGIQTAVPLSEEQREELKVELRNEIEAEISQRLEESITTKLRSEFEESITAKVRSELLTELIAHTDSQDYLSLLTERAETIFNDTTWKELKERMMKKFLPLLETRIFATIKAKLFTELVSELTPVMVSHMTPGVTKRIEEHLGYKLREMRQPQSDRRIDTSPPRPSQRPPAPQRPINRSTPVSPPDRHIIRIPRREPPSTADDNSNSAPLPKKSKIIRVNTSSRS